MTPCKRCGTETVYASGICGYCQRLEEQSKKVSEKPKTPLTGARCGCKRGVQRDNCPTCEGTGLVIDFRAIHAAREASHAR